MSDDFFRIGSWSKIRAFLVPFTYIMKFQMVILVYNQLVCPSAFFLIASIRILNTLKI